MSALPSGLSGGNANLVPCVTNANLSLSATPTSGGGGGGGGGPNPAVSTIFIEQGKISYDPVATSLVLTPANISSLTVSTINGMVPGTGEVLPAGISTNTVNVATGTTLTLNSGNSATQITLDSNKGDVSLIANSGSGTLQFNAASMEYLGSTILADNLLTIEALNANLNISSINGVAPGGGGGGSIGPYLSTVSSITNLSSINVQGNVLRVNGTVVADALNAGITTSGITNNGVIYNANMNASVGWNTFANVGPNDYIYTFLSTSVVPGYKSVAARSSGNGFDANMMLTLCDGAQQASSFYSGFGSLLVGSLYLGGGSTITTLHNPPANLVGDQNGSLFLNATNTFVSSMTISSINGNVPALTSATQNDIAQLFNALFQANPSLSTIVI